MNRKKVSVIFERLKAANPKPTTELEYNTPFELLNHPEIFDAIETLKKAGKVRNLSVSAHTDPAGILEAAVKTNVYSAAMVAYNIINGPFVEKAIETAANADFGVRPPPVGAGIDDFDAVIGHAPGAGEAVVKQRVGGNGSGSLGR